MGAREGTTPVKIAVGCSALTSTRRGICTASVYVVRAPAVTRTT